MSDISQQIADIEDEIRKTPYHKGTEHHIGLLRARIARLKDKQFESEYKGGGGGGRGYAVKQQGDATIVLIGPPSVGKSTLLNKLTNAHSKIAPYAFTTVSVIPGMFVYKDARIQILDVPGLIKGAEEGRGRGREVLSVARGADLLIIMTDPENLDAIEKIKAALTKNGIRINTAPPKVKIQKKSQGGIIVHSNIKLPFGKKTIADIANEFMIKNAEITIEEKLTPERLFDAFSPNRVYIPAITVINKIDTKQTDISADLFISAEFGIGLDKLKERIWKELQFVRIFLNDNLPLIVKHDSSLADVARHIGTDFAASKTKAKIWGSGAKFPGQEVSLETIIHEGMHVRFI